MAGRQSGDRLHWTDSTRAAFTDAQASLSKACTIALHRPDDQLWIVTDAAVKNHGIGATLYLTRHGVLHLAGFFSAKLRGRQWTWLSLLVRLKNCPLPPPLNISAHTSSSQRRKLPFLRTASLVFTHSRNYAVESFLLAPECPHSCRQPAASKPQFDILQGQRMSHRTLQVETHRTARTLLVRSVRL